MVAIILVSMDWSIFVSVLSALAYLITDWRSLTAAAITPMFLAIICWWYEEKPTYYGQFFHHFGCHDFASH